MLRGNIVTNHSLIAKITTREFTIATNAFANHADKNFVAITGVSLKGPVSSAKDVHLHSNFFDGWSTLISAGVATSEVLSTSQEMIDQLH